jgi:SMI1-KNR4 cell-wall
MNLINSELDIGKKEQRILDKMNASARLESLLGIPLPQDYKEFIDKQGYLSFSNISMEVYGYRLDFDIDKLPCVIAATKMSRGDYDLQTNQIVISHTGFEDFIVILDTSTNAVFELSQNGQKNVMADSFSSWLSAMRANDEE